MRDFAELLSAYFDESLTPAEALQLRAWLKADEKNWRIFVRASVIHSRLRDVMLQHDMRSLVFDEAFVDTVDPEHIASLLDEEEATSARRALEIAEQERLDALAAARRAELLNQKTLPIEQPRTPQALVYASVVATAALLLIAFRLVAPAPDPVIEPKRSVVASPVPAELPIIAEIANSFDAQLQRNDQPIAAGAQLRPGRLLLKRGVAQVKFTSQVTMVVEGPAELELMTADRAKLLRGRVVVRVPHEALGFTLHSDAAAFVDLGTEFGVEVLEPGRASVHVIEGEVAFVPGKGETQSKTLRRGFANEVSLDGGANDIPFDEQKFVRRVPASAYELAVLKSRPLAYWRLNDVAPAAELSGEGKLGLAAFARAGVDAFEARSEEGPQQGPTSGAFFAGLHDGIEVTSHESLGAVANCTYEAWVQPAVGTGPQRIFSTFDRPRSGMAIGVVDGSWYKFSENDLRFHFTVYGGYDCVTATPVKPGQWIHVAATVAADGTPTLYVNGEEIERRFRPINFVGGAAAPADMEPLEFLAQFDEKPAQQEAPPVEWTTTRETPVGQATAGRARIGRNPEGADGDISPERWQGAISNVAVYDRVLDAQEIRRHSAATRETMTDDNSLRAAQSRGKPAK